MSRFVFSGEAEVATCHDQCPSVELKEQRGRVVVCDRRRDQDVHRHAGDQRLRALVPIIWRQRRREFHPEGILLQRDPALPRRLVGVPRVGQGTDIMDQSEVAPGLGLTLLGAAGRGRSSAGVEVMADSFGDSGQEDPKRDATESPDVRTADRRPAAQEVR